MKAERRFTGLHVLIIEDSVELASLFAWILRSAGAVVTTAHDRREGLQALFATTPDVLLCDLELPHGSGLSVVRALRSWEVEAGKRIPAAAVTSIGRAETERECRQAGFDEYVLKPLEPKPLLALVERLAGLARQGASVRGERLEGGDRPW